jgi:hypothetical protein
MKFAIILAAVLLAAPAWAARPFVTDDARLTTAGSCQLESWVRLYESSTEFWALPACNPTGNLEITLGGGRASYTAAETTDDYVLQFKTLFRPLTTNGWGWGLAVGRVEHPEIAPGPNQLGNTYAYLPFSLSFADDRFILHANAGWLRDRASNQERNTWGLGGEYYPHARLAVIAESFGDDKSTPYWQIGLRYSILPNLLQVDATTGQQYGGLSASRWLSFGLRWTPERMF